MAVIGRVRIALTGFPGAPGVMTFYGTSPIAVREQLGAWLGNVAGKMQASVQCRIENVGDFIEDTTGAITDTWEDSPVHTAAGSDSASYPAPSGLLIKWATGTVLDGHRIQGRTFIVPLGGSHYDSAGTIEDAVRTSVQESSAGLVTALANNLCIWHRPKFGPKPTGGGERPLLRPGGHAFVTGSSVPDFVTVLRSRRP